jgi:chorismatase
MNHSTAHFKSLIFRTSTAPTRVKVASDSLTLNCQMPWLAGPESQLLAHGAALTCGNDGGLPQGAGMVTGVLVSKGGASLEEETYELYRQMFAITRGLNRYRIWNYVPRINAVVAGVENYVSFNSGRYRAFTEQFGGIFARDISAASALGTQGGSLTLAFVAGPDPVKHYENPLQMPAAHYPKRYGMNSPLFARGSVVNATDGSTYWHLSGTASVRNAETIGNDFSHQMCITLENIARILNEMAVPALRHAAWKVFLRDRRNLEVCQQRMAADYPGEVAQMMFLEADICRSDLLLEIEGMFHQPPP